MWGPEYFGGPGGQEYFEGPKGLEGPDDLEFWEVQHVVKFLLVLEGPGGLKVLKGPWYLRGLEGLGGPSDQREVIIPEGL